MMQNIEIIEFNRSIHLQDLKSLIYGFQSFVRTLEPEVSISSIYNFNIGEYLDFFYRANPFPKIIYLAYVNNEVAGYTSNYCSIDKFIAVYRQHRYAVLNELFVAEKFRKNGVAKNLIKSSISWAKANKCEYMQVGYAVHNKEAGKVYNGKAGFSLSGQISRIKL